MTDQLPVPASSEGPATHGKPYVVPALAATEGGSAAWRYVEFFTANVRNPNAGRAYVRVCSQFLAWCEQRGRTLLSLRPFDVAAYIEKRQSEGATPSVKQQLAAIRVLFDWLVVGQIALASPVLDGAEWWRLMDAIPEHTVRDLRDRALIAVLPYPFARVSAALAMRVEDFRR